MDNFVVDHANWVTGLNLIHYTDLLNNNKQEFFP